MYNSFNEKPEVQLGNYGELLVREYLEKNGFLVYKSLTDASHPVDFITISKDFRTNIDNYAIRLCEVKTKRRMKYYNATGFNETNLEDYIEIQNKLNRPLYIYFVDNEEKRIYGNYLNKLLETYYSKLENKTYPLKIQNKWNHNNQVVFSLEIMENIINLTPEQQSEINRLEQLS